MDDGDGDDSVDDGGDGGDGDDDGALSLEDRFEDLDRENVGSYSPFPSKLCALLFILVNSPHPMVRVHFLQCFFIYICVHRVKKTSHLCGLFLSNLT